VGQPIWIAPDSHKDGPIGQSPLSVFSPGALPVELEDLLWLDVDTNSEPHIHILNIKVGFYHKPLLLARPLMAPVACGCTMALVTIRLEASLALGDCPVNQQIPDNSEVTWFLLGPLPRASLKIRQGSRFLNGTAMFGLELIPQAQAESSIVEESRTRPTIKPKLNSAKTVGTRGCSVGNVRLLPEFFQIDWLHEHEHGSSEELHGVRKEASILLTALLHKAQTSRRISCRVPDPGRLISGRQRMSVSAKLANYLRLFRKTEPKEAR
jgi:hypothetical protein